MYKFIALVLLVYGLCLCVLVDATGPVYTPPNPGGGLNKTLVKKRENDPDARQAQREAEKQEQKRRTPPANVSVISYHGGLIKRDNQEHTLFPIYYGDDFGAGEESFLFFTRMESFLEDLRYTSWWIMTEQYCDNSEHCAASPYSDDGRAFSDSSNLHEELGNEITQPDVKRIITNAIKHEVGTGSKRDIYVILLDRDSFYEGLCTESCAYHDTVTINGRSIVYALIGNPYYCLDEYDDFSMCSVLDPDNSDSPPFFIEEASYSYAMADSMINLVAAQVAGIVTNPFGTAWYDGNGLENHAKCAWDFGLVECYDIEGCHWYNEDYEDYYLIQRNLMIDDDQPYQLCMNGLEFYDWWD